MSIDTMPGGLAPGIQAGAAPTITAPTIRPDYPEPLWIQAVNLIRGEIERGALKRGMRLPPERELCQNLGISRVTLRKALIQLVDDGVLNASHGRGWYVASTGARRDWPNALESFSETAARMGLEAESEVLRAEEAPATLDEAEELAIAPGSRIFHLERVRLLGGVRIAFDVTRIATSLVPNLSAHDFRVESLYEALTVAGIEPSRADTTIEAREADATMSSYLELERGKPLLVMHQVAVDADEHPLFASTITYAGDRYRLRTFFMRGRAHSAAREAK
jgi:GntR family transcriptional regulator